MELVANKDEKYMRSFKMLNNADVNETEMKESSSSSKFVSAYCRRKTIAIDLWTTRFVHWIPVEMERSITEGEPFLGQNKQDGRMCVSSKLILPSLMVLMLGLTCVIVVALRFLGRI